MKALALINTKLITADIAEYMRPVMIANNEVQCGLIDAPQPSFDRENEANKDYVLVKVKAFSCNYRDKAIILKSALKMKLNEPNLTQPVAFFGSDFVGTIISKGKDVENVEIGDRVIPDCYYPDVAYEGIAPGVVTNEASKGWLRLHKSKVMKITEELSDSVAAGFSIGAQTSHSMIRRTNITCKEKALVFSGRSHTSLFITKSLLKLGVDTTVLTTSEWTKEQEEFIKPARLVKIERSSKKRLWEDNSLGKYDVVFDPFFDLHLLTSVNLLNLNGRYITCGFKNQHNDFKEAQDDLNEMNTMNVMLTTMINNLSIIGNCIGTIQDLYDQIQTYNAKQPLIAIDKILDVTQGSEFLNLTYNDNNRFGKVIMKYI
ncbi:zinc-binding alcohol dehydrogenase family protein [Enterococcus faecium]|nr:zinc-binding alcohol dehydrogenase family protein [Enterococcus faecium]